MSTQRKLTIPSLFKAGVFEPSSPLKWTCRFPDGRGIACIHYQLIRDRFSVPRGMLLKNASPATPSGNLQYAVGITTTRSWHGKTWYWFSCPLLVNQTKCQERTREIYLLPSLPYFACHSCYEKIIRNGYDKQKGSLGWVRRLTQGKVDIGVKSWEGPVLTRALDLTQVQFPRSILQRGCPHCGHWIAGTYCPSCGKATNGSVLQNHFETLDLKPDEEIDQDAVKKAYHKKVLEYHPDRVAHLGIKIRKLADEEIQRINQAFETLATPEARKRHAEEVKRLEAIMSGVDQPAKTEA